jgi:hypothetical protein
MVADSSYWDLDSVFANYPPPIAQMIDKYTRLVAEQSADEITASMICVRHRAHYLDRIRSFSGREERVRSTAGHSIRQQSSAGSVLHR